MKGLGFVLISLLPLCDWCHEQDGQYAGHTVKGPQVSRRAPEEQHKGVPPTRCVGMDPMTGVLE